MNAPNPVNDITLSAWLDGELSGAEARSVEQAIADNPALQQRVDALLGNEQKIKASFRQMVEERPVPERLAALLDTSSQASGGWLPALRDWFAGLGPGPGLAVASVTLMVLAGVLATQWMADRTTVANPLAGQADGLIAIGPDHAWYALLETTPSGQMRNLSGQQLGQVALSYRSRDGAFCRQFQVQDGSRGVATAAVACREPGHWQVELAQRMPAASEQNDLFRAASAGDLAALDAFVMAHGDGEVLVGPAEVEILGKGWR